MLCLRAANTLRPLRFRKLTFQCSGKQKSEKFLGFKFSHIYTLLLCIFFPWPRNTCRSYWAGLAGALARATVCRCIPRTNGSRPRQSTWSGIRPFHRTAAANDRVSTWREDPFYLFSRIRLGLYSDFQFEIKGSEPPSRSWPSLGWELKRSSGLHRDYRAVIRTG